MKTEGLPALDLRKDLFWAARLIECLNEMGERQTNAVLLSLDGSDKLIAYRRYPQIPFYFGQQYWRAYYHSHTAPTGEQDEHGHFHFFSRAQDDQEWQHVVALSMNSLGQPMKLFTTNLWVTGGQWLEAEAFATRVMYLQQDDGDNLVTAWFRYMLILHQQEIEQLLTLRDERVAELYPQQQAQCFDDRDVNTLSERSVNLNDKLLEIFSPTHN